MPALVDDGGLRLYLTPYSAMNSYFDASALIFEDTHTASGQREP
jgi:hypothetical protein